MITKCLKLDKTDLHTLKTFSNWLLSYATCFFKNYTSSACLFSSTALRSASVLSAASNLALCSASCLLILSFSSSSSLIRYYISLLPYSASKVFLMPKATADSYSV